MSDAPLTLGLHQTKQGQTFKVIGWAMDIGRMREDGSLERAPPIATVTIKYAGRLHRVKVGLQ